MNEATVQGLDHTDALPALTPDAARPLTPAWVARLKLTDFRSYATTDLEFDRRPVVLSGINGAGKTNLLEAISYLAPGRGLKGAKLGEVGRREPGDAQAGAWAVAARLMTPRGTFEVGTGFTGIGGREKRVVRIDRGPQKSQASLAEVASALWLTPEMDKLFLEGTSKRRRFLDRLVLGFDPGHSTRLASYEHAVRERAQLLIGDGGDGAWLDVLEREIAALAVALACARRDVVVSLNAALAGSVGPFPGVRLEVRGTVEAWIEDGPALATEDRLVAALRSARPKDAELGGASIGPHRSDLGAWHLVKGHEATACSTGEQKTMLIAVVLAAARLQAAERGALPILLLDEVAAHLDDRARASLIEAILELGAQAWLAGTDAGLFRAFGEQAQFWRVDGGRVQPGRANGASSGGE
ncbi:MAG: DNA replication/repair protein RecF [Rhodospirillales bacterium]|nr:DNA replication/repair protein RecF [Rhodospirillales bacterium]